MWPEIQDFQGHDNSGWRPRTPAASTETGRIFDCCLLFVFVFQLIGRAIRWVQLDASVPLVLALKSQHPGVPSISHALGLLCMGIKVSWKVLSLCRISSYFPSWVQWHLPCKYLPFPLPIIVFTWQNSKIGWAQQPHTCAPGLRACWRQSHKLYCSCWKL